MSWYKATANHDRMDRGKVYWLEDTPDVGLRVKRGLLEPAEEPEWSKRRGEVQRQRDTVDNDWV